MRIGLDTNIVLRNAVLTDPQHDLVSDAIDRLFELGWQPVVVPQVLVELWSVLTRPQNVNGLGYSPENAAAEITEILSIYPLVDYDNSTPGAWLSLCRSSEVRGRQTHDAHLAAALTSAGIDHLLTLNTADFLRYQALTCFTPQDVLKSKVPTLRDGAPS